VESKEMVVAVKMHDSVAACFLSHANLPFNKIM